MNNCINSSKVYCKYATNPTTSPANIVLIVAKCIVNDVVKQLQDWGNKVLIVAKCIVNFLI